MYVMLAFDTEDIYFPPEHRVDDIPGWLAEIMTETGIVGTFFVMGEKARTLMERGRTDVLEKMAQHDIASHQQGNRHPLIPELLQDKGWQEGVEAIRDYEDWVKEGLAEAFGKAPVAFSRHNNYFGPQHVAVAGERGLPYMYMVAQLPGSRQPMWYAGALTFPLTNDNFFGGFDAIYSRDELFEARLKQLDEHLRKRLEEGRKWGVVFACHPCRVMTRGWFEHFGLASGMSRTPQDLGWHYDVKPREEENRAKTNFRRLCTFLKTHPDLEVVGISDMAGLYAARPPHVTRDALTFYAAEFARQKAPVFHEVHSPAEMACALAESIICQHEHGDLPETAELRDALGPVERPVIAPEQDVVTHEELVDLCRELLAAVEKDGRLPANLHTADQRVGLSQFALLAARAYLALASYEKYEKLRVGIVPRWPELAFELDGWIRKNIGEHWALPLDFSCDVMAEHARLQTWTMKPAWISLPQGQVVQGENNGPRRLLESD